ncbi:hypothetical protein MA16_Dca018992 [Dendrobium catenatum]|uniref:Uncharacterized protein n=1 Tax=Dendrobium catenatum TaxID=906689 RepID=A0A2I0VLY5_9ASPA|nr:hypothetical protein MA16_Dca018992 [Dendrobium catenatum]
MAGMRVLRRAAEHSVQLSSYFSLYRSLGVLNAAEIPPVESIPEEDICDLEALWDCDPSWRRTARLPAARVPTLA